jgi:hypothetical protein
MLTREAAASGDRRLHDGELFRSVDLVVRQVGSFSRDVLVVTFDSYTDHRDPHTSYGELDRWGFGENFLRDRAIDAVHVIGGDNNWYQYPEMPDAMAVIATVARAYRRVISYGSSMGGYAAIRYGGAAGAEAALAISPQFSIDPAVVPFEWRWDVESQQIDFALERSWTPAFVATAYILFDPRTLDRRHMTLFAKQSRVVPVPMPNSGHSIARFLADNGLLQQAVFDVANGAFNARALRRAARAALDRQSPRHFRLFDPTRLTRFLRPRLRGRDHPPLSGGRRS